MKHTPGPWEYRKGYDNLRLADCEKESIAGTIRSADGWNVARVWASPSIDSDANAALLAAAPEMLDACKAALGHIDLEESTAGRVLRRVLEAAIAKAEGRE